MERAKSTGGERRDDLPLVTSWTERHGGGGLVDSDRGEGGGKVKGVALLWQ